MGRDEYIQKEKKQTTILETKYLLWVGNKMFCLDFVLIKTVSSIRADFQQGMESVS